MNINGSTTSLSFYPFVEFTTLSSLTVQVYHKPTKTLASHVITATQTNTKITVALPSLTAISSKAKNLDEILVRVVDASGVLRWEYMGMWVVGSTSLQREWNGMTTTDGQGKQWITL